MHLKCDLWRNVERDGNWALQSRIPGDSDDFSLLEDFVEETKTGKSVKDAAQRLGYHFLIFTPFRYDVPVPPEHAARFRPAHFMKNVFYGGTSIDVTVYEASFYFMKERRHLPGSSGSAELRIAFSVGIDDPKTTDIRNNPDVEQIMDRSNYTASHAFILKHPCDSLLYPSARYPGGECVAVFEIKRLEKLPKIIQHFRYQYLKATDRCVIFDMMDAEKYSIRWGEVS